MKKMSLFVLFWVLLSTVRAHASDLKITDSGGNSRDFSGSIIKNQGNVLEVVDNYKELLKVDQSGDVFFSKLNLSSNCPNYDQQLVTTESVSLKIADGAGNKLGAVGFSGSQIKTVEGASGFKVEVDGISVSLIDWDKIRDRSCVGKSDSEKIDFTLILGGKCKAPPSTSGGAPVQSEFETNPLNVSLRVSCLAKCLVLNGGELHFPHSSDLSQSNYSLEECRNDETIQKVLDKVLLKNIVKNNKRVAQKVWGNPEKVAKSGLLVAPPEVRDLPIEPFKSVSSSFKHLKKNGAIKNSGGFSKPGGYSKDEQNEAEILTSGGSKPEKSSHSGTAVVQQASAVQNTNSQAPDKSVSPLQSTPAAIGSTSSSHVGRGAVSSVQMPASSVSVVSGAITSSSPTTTQSVAAAPVTVTRTAIAQPVAAAPVSVTRTAIAQPVAAARVSVPTVTSAVSATTARTLATSTPAAPVLAPAAATRSAPSVPMITAPIQVLAPGR